MHRLATIFFFLLYLILLFIKKLIQFELKKKGLCLFKHLENCLQTIGNKCVLQAIFRL